MVSSGRTVMPGVSMSTNSAVMPLCRESGEPVRVSRTQRWAYCARLVHTFWPLTTQPPSVRVARQARSARLLPVPGSEKPWHHVSSPRNRRGTISAANSGGA
jgi:hypothetical protein